MRAFEHNPVVNIMRAVGKRRDSSHERAMGDVLLLPCSVHPMEYRTRHHPVRICDLQEPTDSARSAENDDCCRRKYGS